MFFGGTAEAGCKLCGAGSGSVGGSDGLQAGNRVIAPLLQMAGLVCGPGADPMQPPGNEGWGSRQTALNLDWSYRIKKDLGETGKLKWRSEEERTRFKESQRQKYHAYDAFIRRRGHA